MEGQDDANGDNGRARFKQLGKLENFILSRLISKENSIMRSLSVNGEPTHMHLGS